MASKNLISIFGKELEFFFRPNHEPSVEMDFSKLIPEMKNRHKSVEDVFKIASELGPNNLFVAGGVVRDFCCGKTGMKGDIDLFISDTAYKAIDDLQNSYGKKTQNQFGGDRWYPVENDTFYYDMIIISDFYHGLWRCADITDVLNQFDITANAIAFDLCNGELFDIQNGIRDANNKILRAVRFDFPDIQASPKIQISRNSILWFRYNHYAKKLGYTIEPITMKWLMENRFRMEDIDIFKKFFFNPHIVV
jgi:hypothetical protein